MTPKEKAEDLLHKYIILEDNENNFDYDIKCALIAVDYLMKEAETITSLDYWFNVKTELENYEK